MHILVTDVLTCPRCGPGFGLIVLADEMNERRVMEGRLGCANCRSSYPIQDGVVDLRTDGPVDGPEIASTPAGSEGDDPTEGAYRLGALLGVGDAPTSVLVIGFEPGVVSTLAGLLPDARVVATLAEGAAPAESGPNWIRLSRGVPFQPGSLGGLAIRGPVTDGLLSEAARALAPTARFVLEDCPPETASRLEELGMEILLREGSITVACPPRRR